MSTSNTPLRRQLLETLTALVERYPNLRVGQIIVHGLGDGHDLFYLPDEDIARCLNQLLVSYTQMEAARAANLRLGRGSAR